MPNQTNLKKRVELALKVLNDQNSNIESATIALSIIARSNATPDINEGAINLTIKKIALAKEITLDTAELLGYELLCLKAVEKIKLAISVAMPESQEHINFSSIMYGIEFADLTAKLSNG